PGSAAPRACSPMTRGRSPTSRSRSGSAISPTSCAPSIGPPGCRPEASADWPSATARFSKTERPRAAYDGLRRGVAPRKEVVMASIRKEIFVDAKPEGVWSALRDVGALHERVVPGFVVDTRLEADARIVTFGNGMVLRELIVDLDDDTRRIVWSARGG